MSYIATTSNQSHTIAIEKENPQEITLDGQSLSVDWRQLAPLAVDAQGGRYSLLIEGKSYEVYAREISKPDSDGSWYEIMVAGQRFEVHVEDEREKALAGSIKSAHEAGEAIVRAPMPEIGRASCRE